MRPQLWTTTNPESGLGYASLASPRQSSHRRPGQARARWAVLAITLVATFVAALGLAVIHLRTREWQKYG